MTETVEEKTEDKGHELFAKATERTNDLLAELLEQNKLERANRAAPKAEAAKEPPVWTQEQLQAAVDEGKITVGQMVEYLAEVKSQKAVAKVRDELRAELSAERHAGSVEQKIAAYRASFPELNDKSSETRKAVVEKFNELVTELKYDPADLRTELVACQFVLEGKKAPAPVETTGRKRSVESTGSRADTSDKGDSGKLPKWVPAEHRDYYERQIEKGRYKDHNDERLKKDLGYLKTQLEDPRRRARGAA